MSVTIFPPTCRTPRETAFFALAVAAVRRGLSPLSSGDLLEISRSFSLLLSLQSHMEGLVELMLLAQQASVSPPGEEGIGGFV